MIWSIVKQHVTKHNVTFKMNGRITHCKQKFSETSEDDWKQPLCVSVKILKMEYCKTHTTLTMKSTGLYSNVIK